MTRPPSEHRAVARLIPRGLCVAVRTVVLVTVLFFAVWALVLTLFALRLSRS
jgi:hypothetical protein